MGWAGPTYACSAPEARMRFARRRAGQAARTFAQEVAQGLGRRPRSIDPRFLYDRRGSEIFERICGLPEYYIARTESRMLREARAGLAAEARGCPRLVELGPGPAEKTRHLLDAMFESSRAVEYVAVDISDAVEAGCSRLLADYPGLSATGIVDEYEGGLAAAAGLGGGPSLFAFLGSSLGNFDAAGAAGLLRAIRAAMGPRDALLLGLDTGSDEAELLAAYDDAAGVTAEFNLNLLRRINSELGGDLDPGGFAHLARYDAAERRIEMCLRSAAPQRAHIPGAGVSVSFSEGELVRTEYSHKYDVPGIRAAAAAAGLRAARVWDGGRFALSLLRPA